MHIHEGYKILNLVFGIIIAIFAFTWSHSASTRAAQLAESANMHAHLSNRIAFLSLCQTSSSSTVRYLKIFSLLFSSFVFFLSLWSLLPGPHKHHPHIYIYISVIHTEYLPPYQVIDQKTCNDAIQAFRQDLPHISSILHHNQPTSSSSTNTVLKQPTTNNNFDPRKPANDDSRKSLLAPLVLLGTVMFGSAAIVERSWEAIRSATLLFLFYSLVFTVFLTLVRI